MDKKSFKWNCNNYVIVEGKMKAILVEILGLFIRTYLYQEVYVQVELS